MKAERKPFVDLSADIDDTRLERLAQEKGVATMVKTAPQPEQGAEVSPEPVLDPESSPTPRSKMKNLNIEIPAYVWTELKVRAAHCGTTIRHVIMTSLVSEGFEIRPADMFEDGRSRDRT